MAYCRNIWAYIQTLAGEKESKKDNEVIKAISSAQHLEGIFFKYDC